MSMSINGVPFKVSCGTSTADSPAATASTHREFGTSTRMSSVLAAADARKKQNDDEDDSDDVLDFSAPFLFSDITLVVEEKVLHAHRAVLSLWSPVFKAMFRSQCKESENHRLLLPEDKHVDIVALLRHMYTPGGRDMDSSQALTLLPLLHRYQVDILVKQCETRMQYAMTDHTAIEFLQLADIYQLSNLRRSALDRCAKIDANMLENDLQELKLSSEVQLEIYKRRVVRLETAVRDIQGSMTKSCSKMEAKMERVPENHCSLHSGPLATNDMGFPCPTCLEHFKNHLKELCKRALNRPNVIILKE